MAMEAIESSWVSPGLVWPGSAYPLGATFDGVGTNFAISADRAQGVELCRTIRSRTVVPVHYEGWSHFRQGRGAIERALADAPDVRDSFRILPIGLATDLTV